MFRSSILICFCFLFLFCPLVFGDVYLQMHRGSNNRLDEANRDRNNANRLFDSQNNNRGGYNVGSIYHYVGEIVRLEWTNQHSCNSGNANCDLILQYMCDDWLRDGTTTNRIPNTPEADANPEYGRQESYEYYKKCSTRQRNMGLFTASQDLQGQTAIFTRQNPNGNRHGFECPEERDYYPYWHPTPWKDIAIFTDNMDRCQNFFQKESQNVKNKGACFNATEPFNEIYQINNARACEALRHQWKQIGAWNIDPPKCVPAPWTRDNHNGNTFGGETPHWNWVVPDDVHERCALRLRYNISTNDYDGWNTNSSFNDREGLKLNLAARFGSATPYPFENNPEVDIGNGVVLELAINTAQYGRTFQDRSHRFSIRPRPSEIGDANIYAVSVRGKRGNIVQTYPGTEYDFTPNDLEITTDDYVHFVWTGSNTNPANNDGQGRAQSDRSNVVGLKHLGHVIPAHLQNISLWEGVMNERNGRSTKRTITDFMSTTGTRHGQFGGELSELDDAATYFDAATFRITQTGKYQYMSSRNNNFSNRQQKATMTVTDGSGNGLSTGAIVGIVIAVVVLVILGAIAAVAGSVYYRKHQQQAVLYSQVSQEPVDPSSMYIAPE